MRRFILGLFASLWMTASAFAGVPCSLPFNLQNGTTADATQVMANYNALVTCLGNAAAAGANTDITALLGLTTPLTPSVGGTSTFIGGTSTGGANAQVVATTVPTGYSLTAGYSVIFIAGFTNTDTMTLTVNSLTVASTTSPACSSGTCPPSFYRQTPSGLAPMRGGEIVAGQLYIAFWDGTQFELLSNPAQLGGAGPVVTIPSATSTDLTLAKNHNAIVSGTTTITDFGANGSLAYPIYQVTFSGSLTITYNQTNCSTTGGCINMPSAANIVTQANDTAVIEYLGNGSGGPGNWQIISYTPYTGSSIITNTPLCGTSRLVITNNAGTPNTNVDVTALRSVMLNSLGIPKSATSVSLTINTTTGNVTSTANGMDGENRPTSGWVYFYLINNGTTQAGLGSTSSTAPTLPSGYTYSCYIGAMVTDGSANFLKMLQRGKNSQYVITASTLMPNIANGATANWSLTSPVLAGVSITGVVPTTAIAVNVVATSRYNNGTNSYVLVAPNTTWGGTNRGPEGSANSGYPIGLDITPIMGSSATIVLEGTTIAWAASAAGGAISAAGYIDSVNAN